MEEEEVMEEVIRHYMTSSAPIVINRDIEHFIRSIFERLDKATYDKLLKAINFINEENFSL